MSGSGWDKAAVEFVRYMRGGCPERCDFCDKKYTDGRCPVPEEGGAWSCSECEHQAEAKP